MSLGGADDRMTHLVHATTRRREGDPRGLLVRQTRPVLPIAADHLERQSRWLRLDGPISMAGSSTGRAARRSRARSTCRSAPQCCQARSDPARGCPPRGCWLVSSALLARQWSRPTSICSPKGMSRAVAGRPRSPPRMATRPVTIPVLADFERAATQSEARPFNTGRTLIDARTAETWRRLTHRAARSLGADDLGYADPSGLIELRRSICDYLRAARGVRCDPEQVVVTAGTQQAIDIALRVLLAPGDEVWGEEPGYPLTHAQLLLAKTRPHPVPVDAQGLVVEAGLRAAPRARAAFVTPSHQFPTGVALSMARRLELLAWARASGAFIVEDDYTSEFRYSGPPLAALQGLDVDERVIYVGTLNKALFPGLRLGYAVVPQALLPAFVSARYLMDRQPPTLHQAVVAGVLQQGHFRAPLRRMRHMYREHRDALAATLTRRAAGRLDVEVPDQGMHLVAYLKGGAADTEIE